jgi:virginiamycin A acetyltransferase
LTAPLWMPCRLERSLNQGESLFAMATELLSMIPGPPGIILRRGFFRATLESCAMDASIGFGTLLAHPEVKIGRGVYVGPRCSLGMVVLEDQVTIGSNVDVLSGRHQHAFEDPEQPVQEQERTFRRITIGHNTWIGNSAVIMADVGPFCVIGAGSVVVKPIAEGSVAVGNPATVRRQRLSKPLTS